MLRNRDGVVKVKRENVGEGFWEEVIAVINEGDQYHEAKIIIRQGAASIRCPLVNRSSSNGEVLIQELRELKALLNALPEI